MKSFDLAPKIRDEFKERTTWGGLVSIASLVLMLYLFVSSLVSYWTPQRVETISVDDQRNLKLRINFDVTFPAMPCSLISLDVMDVTGAHQTEVMDNVFKRRLDMNGSPIDESHRNELRQTATTKEHLGAGDGSGSGSAAAGGAAGTGSAGGSGSEKEVDHGTDECGSCYGAGEPGQCCHSCDEVKQLYKIKGWSFDPATVKQCSKDAIAELQKGGPAKEGCNLYGFVEVPRVAGNIHFAPGRSFQHAGVHAHDLVQFVSQAVNVTHTINSFSFGRPYPKMPKLPLEGHAKTLRPEDGNGMFQYYVKVVPTDYIRRSGKKLATNQYSVTEHFRPISATRGSGLPGVFFFFDISPIRVTVDNQSRSFFHFVTQLCAIIGGVFTVMGAMDSGLHQLWLRVKTEKTIA